MIPPATLQSLEGALLGCATGDALGTAFGRAHSRAYSKALAGDLENAAPPWTGNGKR